MITWHFTWSCDGRLPIHAFYTFLWFCNHKHPLVTHTGCVKVKSAKMLFLSSITGRFFDTPPKDGLPRQILCIECAETHEEKYSGSSRYSPLQCKISVIIYPPSVCLSVSFTEHKKRYLEKRPAFPPPI